MARRTRNTNQSSTDQSSTTDQSVTEPTSEDTVSTSTVTDEAPASTDTEASTDQTDTSTEQADGDKASKAKPEIDLSAFEAAVQTAVEERDTTTGLLPLAAIEPVVKEYRALDGLAPKNAAKKRLQHLMTEVMNSLDLPSARAYLELLNNLTPASSGGGGTERVPADPTEAFTQRVAGLRLSLILAEAHVPEGVNEAWEEKVSELLTDAEPQAAEYYTWVNADSESRGEAPEVPSWVAGAVKLSQGRSGKVGGSTKSGNGSAFTGERRDVAKHILSAFEGVESGTFLSIAEIKKTPSDEYGTDSPSAGAISARLFPKSGKTTVEGIRPGEKDNRKGAFKL